MNELSKSVSLDEPEDAFEEYLLFNLVYCSQVSPGIEQAKVHQSMLKMMVLSVTALVSVAFSVNGYAESSTSTMNVSVSVEYSCAIESSPMEFGAYSGVVANASTTLNATATVVATCTSGAGARVTLDGGASPGLGSPGAPIRRMRAGEGQFLAYQVYSDVARGSVWGNTAVTGVALTGTGVPQILTAYGSVMAAQLAVPGAYSDELVVTITY